MEKNYMNSENHVNVAIIGAGPSGIGTALGLAKKGIKSIYIATFSLALISFMILLIVGLIVQYLILNPIQALTHHTDTILQTNNFNLRIAMDRKDEIGILSDGLDTLVCKIEKQTKLLKNQATRDSLTGLANRRSFDKRLDDVGAEAEKLLTVLIDTNHDWDQIRFSPVVKNGWFYKCIKSALQ